jgi:hypothetical protein
MMCNIVLLSKVNAEESKTSIVFFFRMKETTDSGVIVKE